MSDLNRNSFADAKKHISQLISIHGNSKNIATFLSEKIKLANDLNPHNWNLNLSLNGKFLRFNVGQVYCIQIEKHETLILCIKDDMPHESQQEHSDFFFRGYSKGSGIIDTTNFKETPQCLAKVPNSIGVVLKHNIDNWLPSISRSNSNFIQHAISNTKILPQMIRAHSVGAIEYLSEVVGMNLPNPFFVYTAIAENEERVLKKLKNISDEKLLELARTHNSYPRKAETTTSIFIRNPYIVEQAKRTADSKCQDCGNPAPFIKKGTNEPYLEVHHILPLSQGGKDTIENVVALCPNCHRKRHHG